MHGTLLDTSLYGRIIALDDYLPMSADKTIYGEDILELTPRMCADIQEALKEGLFVIVDHVITDKVIYESVLKAFNNYSFCKVLITCDSEILKQREIERGNRCVGSAEESLKYLYPKEGYDLVVDSSRLSTEQIVEKVVMLI